MNKAIILLAALVALVAAQENDQIGGPQGEKQACRCDQERQERQDSQDSQESQHGMGNQENQKSRDSRESQGGQGGFDQQRQGIPSQSGQQQGRRQGFQDFSGQF